MSHFDEENEESPVESGLRVIAKCQCGGCKRFFSGMGAFDAHRTGPYQQRRCMTEDEMRTAGMDKEQCLIRMYHDGHPAKERHEVWYDVAKREEMQARLALGKVGLHGAGPLPDATSFEEDDR